MTDVRQFRRQLRFPFGAIAVVRRRWRELCRSMNGHVETARAIAGGIRPGTQNPAAFGLTSSSLVPGTPSPATTYASPLGRRGVHRESESDKKADKSASKGRDLPIGHPSEIDRQYYADSALRDRELAAINYALRSGTAAKVLG